MKLAQIRELSLNWMWSRAKVTCQDKWSSKKDTLRELEHRRQLIVRLKANKAIRNCSALYLPISTSWTSWIFKASVIGSWPLAGFMPLALDPDLWPTPNSKGGACNPILINCLVNRPVSWSQSNCSQMIHLLCCNPIALSCLLVWIILPIASLNCKRSKIKSIYE